ncbi:MAG: hypothetical protein R3F05_16960 [Planctomycetota bacterium]
MKGSTLVLGIALLLGLLVLGAVYVHSVDTPGSTPSTQHPLSAPDGHVDPPAPGLVGVADAPQNADREPDVADGVAWSIAGHVVTIDEGEPIAAAQVLAWWCVGEACRRIGEATTDEAGAFEIALPEVAAMSPTQQCSGQIEVRARAEGFGVPPTSGLIDADLHGPGVQRPIVDRLDPRAGPHFACVLGLVAGSVLQGRLVSECGRPLPHQGVYVDGSESTEGSWQVCTDAEGRFKVVVPPRGTFRISAEVRRFGNHQSEGHVTGRDAGDLVVRAAGALRGSVVDSHGDPWAGFDVTALAIDGDSRGLRIPSAPCFDALFRGDLSPVAATDDEGRFTLPLPISWLEDWLVLPDGKTLAGGATWGTSQAVDDFVRLTVDGVRVQVVVRDRDGLPVGNCDVHASGWPDEASFQAGLPAEWTFRDLTSASGRVARFTGASTVWEIDVRSRGGEVGLRDVVVAQGEREQTVEVLLQPPEPSGWLVLDVRDAVEAADGATADFACQLAITTTRGRPVFEAQHAAGARVELAAGSYQVTLRPHRKRVQGGQTAVTQYLPWRGDVDIAAGTETKLRAELRRAGQLAVSLAPRLLLPIDGSGTTLDVSVHRVGEEAVVASDRLYGMLTARPPVVTDMVLAPGDYELRATSSTTPRWSARMRTCIEAGETANVTFDLAPEDE